MIPDMTTSPRIQSQTARLSFGWRQLLGGGACVLAVLFAVSRLSAEPPAPVSAGETTSLLQQLSDETQRVYGKARLSMVRVQLPTPQWLEQINRQKEFLDKWGNRLDPAVREQIIEQQERAVLQLRQHQGGVPSSQPAGVALEIRSTPRFDLTTRPSMPPTSQPALGKLQVTDGHRSDPGNLVLIVTGLLVDTDGHAVFPTFVDKKVFGDNLAMLALTGDGQPTRAKFVGSDRQTNLTVLQLEKHTGQAVALGHSRPDDGVLTLVIAGDGGARLVVWSNLHPEPGLAVLPDGSVAGFGFDGHFLGASTAKPIVDQLIATGEVRRAVLGVTMSEVAKEDLIRQSRPELGSQPAIRILAVDPDTAASRGGVQTDDLILAVGGEPVGDPPTFGAVIATRSGPTVLHVLRGSHLIDLTVDLRPK